MSPRRQTDMCSFTSSEMNSGIMRVRTLKDSLSSRNFELKLDSASSSCSSVLDESQSTSCTCSSVRFSDVHIREYDVTIGDNPSCSHGAPISLDWNYGPSDLSFHIEQYEEAREPYRRCQAELKMPSRIRLEILRDEWECSLKSIMAAQVEISKERKKRMQTAIKARKAIQRGESISAITDCLKNMFHIRQKKDRDGKLPTKTIFLESTETVSDSSEESSNDGTYKTR